jgi:erythromycin esterase-like protein
MAIRAVAYPLTGEKEDFSPLLDLVGDARLVLLGEASHGTHEFYRERARITRQLVQDKGFCAVAVEADWPDAYRVNRYVRGVGHDGAAVEALGDFRRFPAWMWRNADVLDFVGWLRSHNDAQQDAPDTKARRPREPVGFYGLDLYSLHSSMDAVLHYLDKVDPEAARRARDRYGCFDHFGADPQAYGYATELRLQPGCEDDVVVQLVELRRRAAEYAQRDGRVAADEFFFAEQNARLVRNAERYYRSMFRGRVESWNLRDQHMAETLQALLAHLDRPGAPAKIVVWAHNSHLGDARATDMGRSGELNVGQLARERFGSEVVLVGFTTYTGTVTAASDWGAPAERKRVRPARPDSYEGLLHTVGYPRFFLSLRDGPADGGMADAVAVLRETRLERAIGVIYRPETERASHYFHAELPAQFDAVLHYDETRAVEPLERDAGWERGELPETYPTAI